MEEESEDPKSERIITYIINGTEEFAESGDGGSRRRLGKGKGGGGGRAKPSSGEAVASDSVVIAETIYDRCIYV